MRRFIAVLLVVFISPAMALAQSNDAQTPDLKATDTAFAKATAERGIDGWMSFFADDAYVGTNPSIRGKLDLRQFYQRLFSRRDLKFEWAPDHSEVFPNGTMGYTSGRYKMSFTNFQGKTMLDTGSYLTVWQKQPDGSWKVLSDYGSQDKPQTLPKKADAQTQGDKSQP